MASAALQIIGTVVGAYFGGPIGASIGGAIGGAIGSALEPTKQFEGPKLDDLKVSSASYGAPIPLLYGEYVRVAGNIIWATDLVETSHEEKQESKGGGGGTSTTTYTYSTSLAVALGRGPVRSVRRIWCNKKIFWDSADLPKALISAQETAAKAQENVDTLEGMSPAPAQEVIGKAQAEADAAQAAVEALEAAITAVNTMSTPWALGSEGIPAGTCAYLAFYPGTYTQDPDPCIEQYEGAGEVPGYRGTCYVVLGGLQLADYGNAVPNIEFEVDGLEAKCSGGVLFDVVTRSGMVQGDFSINVDKTDAVGGYAVSSAGDGMSVINPLQVGYGFEVLEAWGCLRFSKRGHGVVATLPIDEGGARDPGGKAESPFTTRRAPDHELIKRVSITYADSERDYQEGTQTTPDYFGYSDHIQNNSLPLTMTPAQARLAADRILADAWASRTTASTSVSDRWSWAVPGNIIVGPHGAGLSAYRVNSYTRGANGNIKLELAVEGPYIGQGGSGAATVVSRDQTVAEVGDTFARMLNTPILAAGESATAVTWAMTSSSSGWRGGQIFRSLDYGLAYSSIASTSTRYAMGTVSSALPASSPDLWDRVNTVTVTMLNDADELSSVTEEEVLNGKNAFWLGAADGSHGEVVQAATVTLITSSPRVYALSNLLRGRRATEHETALHGSDEILVRMAQAQIKTVDFGSPDWDKERTYKGVSVYQTLTDATDIQYFTNTGERSMCRAPVLGAGSRDGSNNLTITWVRRIRGFAPGLGYGSVPLDEPTEAYEVDVYTGSSVVRTISATSPTVTYTAAQQTADGKTPGAAVHVKIYQISATRGRGHAGDFTV